MAREDYDDERRGGGRDPGRGTLLLVLGILGLVCCGILLPITWIMAAGDLKRIAAGSISREAEPMTKVAMYIGMIGTILVIVGWILFFLLGGMALFTAGQAIQNIK